MWPKISPGRNPSVRGELRRKLANSASWPLNRYQSASPARVFSRAGWARRASHIRLNPLTASATPRSDPEPAPLRPPSISGGQIKGPLSPSWARPQPRLAARLALNRAMTSRPVPAATRSQILLTSESSPAQTSRSASKKARAAPSRPSQRRSRPGSLPGPAGWAPAWISQPQPGPASRQAGSNSPRSSSSLILFQRSRKPPSPCLAKSPFSSARSLKGAVSLPPRTSSTIPVGRNPPRRSRSSSPSIPPRTRPVSSLRPGPESPSRGRAGPVPRAQAPARRRTVSSSSGRPVRDQSAASLSPFRARKR